ncbi:MAG: P63C domain-containing protein [Gemmatimonadetes bacterium]|nr:P63C domain-containing protein [Gemmatimonadota bacterium]
MPRKKEPSSGRVFDPAAGGRARAAKLSPEQRSEIARIAAHHRWEAAGRSRARATHEGVLKLGDLDLPVGVLEDGTRVITSAAVLTALGRRWRGRYERTNLPNFLDAMNLIPFIGNDLLDVLSPVEFVGINGRQMRGYRAELLPLVCDVYLSARHEKKLTRRQEVIATRAEMLVRSLSKVGIVALVDEATGYQEVRDRLALQALLDRYLAKELAAWATRFPAEFYQQIFRLRSWGEATNTKTPRVVGKYINDVVYARLAPGILAELQERNPVDAHGRRRAKHHQWLTEDVGHPALAQHLHAVTALMRISDSWDEFKSKLERAFPRKTKLSDLPLFQGAA